MTSPLTEKAHAGEFILSKANGNLSFDNGTLVSGNDLFAGTVLGKLTANGKWTAYDNVGSDGSELASGILFDAVDASAGDAACVVLARDAEVIGDSLTYAVSPSGEAAAIVDLALVHIIVR